MKDSKISGSVLAICVLSIYILQCITSGINPALASLGELYPDVSLSTITMVSTICMLASMPGNLLSGTFVKKIGFKQTMFIAFGFALAGGLTPFFIECHIYVLIFLRAMVGFAYGIFMPMGASCISAFYQDEKRSKMLGYGSSVSGLSSMIIILIGGWLVNISVRMMWLYHLIVLLPMFCVMIMPTPPQQDEISQKQKGINWSHDTWFFIIAQGVIIFFLYPILVYMSNIIVTEGMGSSVDAGYVSSVHSFACFISGFVFSYLLKIFKKRLFGTTLLCIACGFLCVALAENLLLLYIGNVLSGFGYMTFVTYCMDSLSRVTKSSQLSTALGVGFACSTIVPTISVYVFSFIGQFMNISDGNVRYMFIISSIAFLMFGTFFFLRPRKVMSENI